MGSTLTYKLLAAHLMGGELTPCNEIAIRIDQTLTQDATGTMAYLQFEAIGVPKVKTDISVSYVDHNTLQDGFENADDHKYLQTVAAKHGIYYSKAGTGVCHQVHLERFGIPGKTLIGSDSHTPTGGGIGMIAIGAGGLDVAVAMGGGPFYLTAPKVVGIKLTGKLKPWVAAKDVILKVLEILTTKGNVGTIVEYYGEGINTLSVPERATITNMGAELGVTTSLFPSDEITLAFMKAQKREKDWKELKADPDAVYDRIIEIDLGELVPRTSKPHSPDNIAKVSEMKGVKVDQILIGSCTNSSYRDLMLVAKALKGKKINPDVSFGVAPGSKQVLEMIARNGALADIISSGARILESACGFCIGNGQAPKTKAISLRTNNRNFEGRSGTKSAQVYLVSPETAIASALTGEFTDPTTLGADTYPQIDMPSEFLIDDTTILAPSDHPETIKVFRGPNIGEPPRNNPLKDSIIGEVTLKVGDKITTDHIMPAGSRLKYRSNIPKYAQFVFEGVDATFATRALANKERGSSNTDGMAVSVRTGEALATGSGIANMIVGGQSYGQGSSREHAALCPMYLGVQVLLAKSLERIHTANLINFGIIPLNFANEADYDKLDQGDRFELLNVKETIAKGGKLMLKDTTKGIEIEVTYNLTERQKEIIFAGGLLNYTKNKQ